LKWQLRIDVRALKGSKEHRFLLKWSSTQIKTRFLTLDRAWMKPPPHCTVSAT